MCTFHLFGLSADTEVQSRTRSAIARLGISSRGKSARRSRSRFIYTNKRALDNLKEHIEWLQEELDQFNKSLSILLPFLKEKIGVGTVSIPLFWSPPSHSHWSYGSRSVWN